MKRFFGLCTGLALVLSTVGCRYYPGYVDPGTGLAQGGYWAPDLTPLNPFCWIGACGYGGCGYGYGSGYGAPAPGYGAAGYRAPGYGAPTYVQPGFAPSYGGSGASGGGGCSECTSSPTYSPGEFVAPPNASPTPVVPATPSVPGSHTGAMLRLVPTPAPLTPTAQPQTARPQATAHPMWIPAGY